MADAASLTLRLLGDSASLRRALDQGRAGVNRFVAGARAEFGALKSAFNSVGGKLAGLGLGLSAAQQLGAAAKLDQALLQVKQTAGATREEMQGLRKDLFDLAQKTGRPVEELLAGFNNLIQAGQTWGQSRETIKGINTAMGVTKASAESLSSALTVASATFDFDLSKPGLALELLDKMSVAGTQGSVELENLSAVFARIGQTSKAAGLGFDKTLAFTEALSASEKDPARLATLAESTLRLFTNYRYLQQAQKSTKVKFFDKDGARRDVTDVLKDIREKFQKLTSEKQQAKFIQRAFGNTDLDTQSGLRRFLSGSSLDNVNKFADEIGKAAGTLNNKLPESIDNGVDQLGRLQATLRKFTDWAAKPVTSAFDKAVNKLIDPKEKGGLGLSGGMLLGGGAASIAAGFLLGRHVPGILGKILRTGSSTAAGVAEGKALEAATGVTPVFVTNWPDSMGGERGSLPGARKKLEDLFGGKAGAAATGLGAAGWAGSALLLGGLLTGAAAAIHHGFGMGSHPGDRRYAATFGGYAFGEGGLTNGFAPLSAAADAAARAADVKNTVNIEMHVDQAGRVVAETGDPGTKVRINSLNRGAFNPKGMRD